MTGHQSNAFKVSPAIWCILFVLMVFLLNGCIGLPGVSMYYLDPHTETRSIEINGTVLDEDTHAPIAGAKIFLSWHPQATCKSDASGHFKLEKINNWHWVTSSTAGGPDGPDGPFWEPYITISHTNYLSRAIYWYQIRDDVVLLKNINEPPKSHPWLIFNGDGQILKDMGAQQYLKSNGIQITDNEKPGSPYSFPSRIHIAFARRVYEPHVTPVNNVDHVTYGIYDHQGLDWVFGIDGVLVVPYGHHTSPSARQYTPDSARQYKLEFTP